MLRRTDPRLTETSTFNQQMDRVWRVDSSQQGRLLLALHLVQLQEFLVLSFISFPLHSFTPFPLLHSFTLFTIPCPLHSYLFYFSPLHSILTYLSPYSIHSLHLPFSVHYILTYFPFFSSFFFSFPFGFCSFHIKSNSYVRYHLGIRTCLAHVIPSLFHWGSDHHFPFVG